MSFYSYFSDVEDGIVAYTFTTKTDTDYRVYFYPASDYSEYVQNYINLLKDGYIFGFTKVQPNEDKVELIDSRIKLTITQIVSDFFDNIGENSILLYHCDNEDGKQGKRNNCFTRWYKDSELLIFMEDTVIVVYDEEGQPLISNYLGFFVKNTNPNLEEIKIEFHSVKEDLIREK